MTKNLDVSIASDITKTVAFAVQMYLAYMLMVSKSFPAFAEIPTLLCLRLD